MTHSGASYSPDVQGRVLLGVIDRLIACEKHLPGPDGMSRNAYLAALKLARETGEAMAVPGVVAVLSAEEMVELRANVYRMIAWAEELAERIEGRA